MDDDQTILGLLHSLVKGQAELLEAFKTRHPPAGQEESSGRSENDRRSESSGRSKSDRRSESSGRSENDRRSESSGRSGNDRRSVLR